jgi:hypothetical protein
LAGCGQGGGVVSMAGGSVEFKGGSIKRAEAAVRDPLVAYGACCKCAVLLSVSRLLHGACRVARLVVLVARGFHVA